MWNSMSLRYICISTHILTRRMTRNGLDETYEPDYFNSHPHEEDDDMSKHCRRPI